ncbi:unnamed protein product [Acanthosepion pharaonis]|uniref:Uncharacterized protein n=1 Tax=Acanthosepion pharaonis TaxID=158019 RepID=A0A812DFF9_ACAPH|nr:unnamed protein product [Sepia pharaonis]
MCNQTCLGQTKYRLVAIKRNLISVYFLAFFLSASIPLRHLRFAFLFVSLPFSLSFSLSLSLSICLNVFIVSVDLSLSLCHLSLIIFFSYIIFSFLFVKRFLSQFDSFSVYLSFNFFGHHYIPHYPDLSLRLLFSHVSFSASSILILSLSLSLLLCLTLYHLLPLSFSLYISLIFCISCNIFLFLFTLCACPFLSLALFPSVLYLLSFSPSEYVSPSLFLSHYACKSLAIWSYPSISVYFFFLLHF